MGKVAKCFYCRLPIENEEDIDIHPIGEKQRNHKFHKGNGCYDRYKMKQMRKIDPDSPEYAEWCNLHDYVKYNILGYSEKMKLSPSIINLLLSLRHGELVMKGDKVRDGGYPFDIIRKTFAFKRIDIDRVLQTKEFANENKKFIYILAIVKNSINDVYVRSMRAKKERENMQSKAVDSALAKPKVETAYIKKTESNSNINDMLNDLW